ncbi:GH1 family beta-glucosidase [Deinococcus maricopensis]|uniref:Beta-glucosidase n=1 Tax=Deinococcus maricopensis (strain DSM 21211 / LMG 22137 / NRRL B-23946 / LB-34) TaxID=709986 RepID=E8U905_DEIML|nr:GH1 family beta-glucosidase [Deinococcus maricopensis]ADV67544.1 beta-galactosidase [Deinococcus maricopensis DSM 21211]
MTATPDPLHRAAFPADFTFGVATSSFQIEGATNADGRGVSIWDTFCREPGRIHDGSTGDVACDHYHRWPEDLNLMRDLGVDAYRFSVAWPRIQADGRGPANTKGLDFYDRLVDGLLERGLQPHMTLYHWDLPQALQDIGGWTNRDVALRFAEYARIVAERLGGRVRSIATLNEPWCSSILSYQIGEHAPGLRDRRAAVAAAHGLLLGHGLAMREMRALTLDADLGIVLNLNPAYPASDRPEDVAAARFVDGTFNRWFLDPILRAQYPQDIVDAYGADAPDVHSGDLDIIAAPIDFMGVNYYSRSVSSADGAIRPSTSSYTDMNWEVYPQGLTDLLVRLHHDYPNLPPIMITENGAAYPDADGPDEHGIVHDPERVQYFQQHLGATLNAIDAGVRVTGYFAWSFMDNFEWAYGYKKRFGLFYVNYGNQMRHWKDSARWYQTFLNAAPAAHAPQPEEVIAAPQH